MSISFTAKNLKLTGAQKGFTEKKLRAIEKISGDIIAADIIITQGKLDVKVEINVKTKSFNYNIEENDPILKQAIRAALANLKKQVKKNKDKIKEEKKRERASVHKNEYDPGDYDTDTDSTIKDIDKITISNNYSKKPLSVEEAVFYLKDSKENAYMFRNSDTNKLAVIFVNANNALSIIEAE
jgi:putative sigma-54 modulation protein